MESNSWLLKFLQTIGVTKMSLDPCKPVGFPGRLSYTLEISPLVLILYEEEYIRTIPSRVCSDPIISDFSISKHGVNLE